MPIGAIESGQLQGLLLTENNVPKIDAQNQFVEFLNKANETMLEAEQMQTDFSSGKNNNIHETIIAAEKASISFKLVGAVRNRMLAAYTEVMNMRL
jgi:flagellar hook-basal body complex protein FliE